ncbi:MAG: hypothetical protein EBY81_07130 [Verrucomicrobia bacterium]|nr:hypothetical protein [Verrucomicrobiota bacterium]
MLQPDGTLLRRYRAGDAAIGGMLDDYVNLAGSLIDLYEATFDPRFLENAIALMRTTIATFGDPENGGFFASSHEDVAALVKLKDDYDGAEPSGNSVALMNLLRLARITGDAQFDTEARRLITQGGVKLDGTKLADPQSEITLTSGQVLQVGKKTFFRILL